MSDARSGNTYTAQATIPYSVGISRRVRLLVNIPAHTYSVYVHAGSAPEQLLGSNFAFRTEQQQVNALSSLAAYASLGSLTVCDVP